MTSLGGTGFRVLVLKQFVTVCKHSRPDFFVNEIGFSTCHAYADEPGTPPMPPDIVQEQTPTCGTTDHTYCEHRNEEVDSRAQSTKKKCGKRKKEIGIKEGEENILHLLDLATVVQIVDDLDETQTPDDATSTDFLLYVLLDERCLLLQDILAQLQYFDGAKWGTTSKEDLYPGLLTSTDDLMSRCTLKDLKIICKTLEHHTERSWFESAGLKSIHVNRIIHAFGGTDLMSDQMNRKIKQIHSPLSLRVLSKRIILDDGYRIEHLQIALGTVLSCKVKADWYRRSTVNPTVFIPFASDDDSTCEGESVELFSYPEVDKNNEVHFKTFDYTHILTNMRTHILNRGYNFCKQEDFEWIVDNTTGVLSRYLVEYNMDSQNAFSAMKLFGDNVILTLESNSRTESVQF